MISDPSGDGLAAALIQISAHAERIGGLDTREANHHADIAAQLADIAEKTTTIASRIDGFETTLIRQTAIVKALDGLDKQVAALARQLAELSETEDDGPDDQNYRPVPAPRWWKLTGPDREAAAGRLRAWVEQIYRPSYGRLATALPDCWEQHPLCLFLLDWLSELWSVLYLAPQRNSGMLAAQGEWQTRLLPAAAEQMAFETATCGHGPRRPPSATVPPRNGTRAHYPA